MRKKSFFYFLMAVAGWLIASCSGDTSEIESLYDKEDVSMEIVKDVVITYSDSAVVQLKVTSPLLKRMDDNGQQIEEFPEGLYVEFFQGRSKAQSWLKADEAIRYPSEKKILMKGNVQLYNDKEDKLETAELLWLEEEQQISTEKFVRITRPEQGDTIYGFGFVSDQHFKRFEIKRRFSGKLEVEMIRGLSE